MAIFPSCSFTSPNSSTRCFQCIAEAFETLNVPEKRQKCDDGEDLNKPGQGEDPDSEEDEREKKSLRKELEKVPQ